MPMDKEKAEKFLQYPSSGLVDFALSTANLTRREAIAIDLCGRKGLTYGEAVEELMNSNTPRETDTIQRWYSSGIRKLCAAWDGVPWIEKLTE